MSEIATAFRATIEIHTVVDRRVVSSCQVDEFVTRLQALAVQANTA